MSDVTVVILTKNEELNIVDAIENAKRVADKVILVDSGLSLIHISEPTRPY